jgi:signal peptidase
MEPAIHTGSLIFVKPESSYKIGDIITRKTTNSKITVTHRIIKKEKLGGKTIFDTKGDANNAPDEANFFQDDIIGQEKVAIPWLGYPVGYAKTTQGLILLIIIPAIIIIYDEMQKIKKEILKKIDYRKRVKKRAKNQEEKENLTKFSNDDI